MSVPVYRPKIQVTLLKQVQRRGSSQNAEPQSNGDTVDLTPFFGDASGIRTTKSLHQPAGSFVLSFADQAHPRTLDTIAAMVEPMDAIEIRGAREPHRHIGQPLPLLMRGWVSDIFRNEEMSDDGPRRTVTIHGQDAGRLWLIHQALFEVALLQEVPFLEQFRMQVATGLTVYALPVSEFIRQLTERVMNEKVRALAAFQRDQFRPFRVDATVKQGTVSVTTSSNIQGPIWKIASTFIDRPWNEFFVEDEEEGPLVRFRPAPYRNLEGRFIMPDATDPGTIELKDDSVALLSGHRSDWQVANFFSVLSPSGMVDTGGMVNVAQLQRGEPLDFQHPNNRPELYGVRRMEATTALLPDGMRPPSSEATGTAVAQSALSVVDWCVQRRTELKLANRDNALFESVKMTARGSEELKIGRYLRLDRGGFRSEAYVTQVAHDIRPLRGWTTALTMDRGTSFIERRRAAAPRSPYLNESGRGPYSQES